MTPPSGSGGRSTRAVADRVGRVPRAAGMTQADLGRALGKGQSWVAKLETGQVRLTYLDALRIAEVTRADIRAFDPDRALELGTGEVTVRVVLSAGGPEWLADLLEDQAPEVKGSLLRLLAEPSALEREPGR